MQYGLAPSTHRPSGIAECYLRAALKKLPGLVLGCTLRAPSTKAEPRDVSPETFLLLRLAEEGSMSKRGKVLRDPHAGPGLLMVEGQQYQFLLEGVWKSDVPPTPGLVVDLEFDSQGKISGITAVPESQIAT